SGTAFLVLAALLLLMQVLELAHGIAADVAHRNPGVLGLGTGLLGVALEGFLGQCRHGHAHGRAGAGRVPAQIGSHDGLFHGLDHALVEYGKSQGAGVFNSDVGDLTQGGIGTVVGHHDAVENTRVCATGTDLGKGAVQRLYRFLHALLRFLLDFVDHYSALDNVPSALPTTALSSAPGLFILNTRKGIL